MSQTTLTRRQALRLGLFGSASALISAVASAQSICDAGPTPDQPEGPFYPIQDQRDKDRDLTQVKGSSLKAEGKVVIVVGTVTDQNCIPVEGALVEIWQACHTGKYNHPNDPNTSALDPNFQYWGRAISDANGNYQFRTIVPGAYPASDDWIRPPHIHFKIQKRGFLELITQMYFAGEALNNDDLYLKRMKPVDRDKLIVNFNTVAEADAPVGVFNISIEKI